MDDKIVRFQIDGRLYEFDAEDMTFDEWDEVERVLGCALEDASAMKGSRALIYIAVRRNDPTFSFEDLGSVKPAKTTVEKTKPEPVEEVPDSRPPALGGAPASVNGSSGSADETVPQPASVAETTLGSSGGL